MNCKRCNLKSKYKGGSTMYIIIEGDIKTKTTDLVDFYVENLSNSTKENLKQDIKDLMSGKSIIDVIKSYEIEVYKEV